MTYPIEVKARAIALFQDGVPPFRVAKLLDLEDPPHHSTLYDWRKEAELSHIIRTQSEELAIRASHLAHRAFDAIEAMPDDKIVKHLGALNFVRGTAIDKLQRDQAASAGNQITFVVLPAAPPSEDATTTIEIPPHTYQIELADTLPSANPEGQGKADHTT